MIVFLTVIGVFICAILAIHTFLTGNSIEAECVKLHKSVDNYYTKQKAAMQAQEEITKE